MMWSKMVESLSGVAQPDPPRAARKVKQLVDLSARAAQHEELKQRRAASAEKEERVLSALRIRGKLASADFDSLGLAGLSAGSVESALRRLRGKGKVRLVMARPYWEVVE